MSSKANKDRRDLNISNLPKTDNNSFLYANRKNLLGDYKQANKFNKMREISKRNRRENTTSPHLRREEYNKQLAMKNKTKFSKKDLASFLQAKNLERMQLFK